MSAILSVRLPVSVTLQEDEKDRLAEENDKLQRECDAISTDIDNLRRMPGQIITRTQCWP